MCLRFYESVEFDEPPPAPKKADPPKNYVLVDERLNLQPVVSQFHLFASYSGPPASLQNFPLRCDLLYTFLTANFRCLYVCTNPLIPD